MATTVMTLQSERWLDEVTLNALVADAAIAAIVEGFLLPAGLGDVAIMSIMPAIIVVGTVPVTATMPRGVRAAINSLDDLTQVDQVGVAPWYATGGVAAAFDRFDAFIDPDALCLWREGELLKIVASEMDAGATGDLRVFVKAVRVRPVEQAGQPIQLVR